MRIAILDVCWKKINPENPFEVAQGGSETWLIQIAREFSKSNQIDVYLDTTTGKSHQENENLTYYNFDDFLTNGKSYDFIILSRFFVRKGTNYIEHIKKNNRAHHVYIQVHDLSLLKEIRYNCLGLMNASDIDKYNLNDEFVTIVALNEWHKSNLLAQYPTLKNIPICIPNGVDLKLFKEYNFKRNNRILWSSCADRGLSILINDVYPLVKSEITDFGIDVARYNDDHKIECSDKDVKIIGKLSKSELYKEMSKHKVWFYPGTFAETFCITMLENIMNGAQIVSPLTYGTAPTIGYSEQIKMKNNFDKTTYNQAVVEAAQKIIEILKTDGNERPEIYQKITNKIKNEYNWTYSVQKYINHYKSNNYEEFSYKELMRTNKKVLFFTMSCNIPHFQGLLAAVRDTWAKDIFFGKYENCIWYAYTSCDKKHPVPCVDHQDHMVYVDEPDAIHNTYEKTRKAYRLLCEELNKHGIEFDYVVRTNASVYVNVPKTLERISQVNDDQIIGGINGYYHVWPDGTRKFMWNMIAGLFYGMTRQMWEIAMSAEKGNNYDTIPAPDDVIISGRIFEVLGDIKAVTPNPGIYNYFPRYKAFLPGEQKFADYTNNNPQFTEDPNIVNQCAVVQIRTLYGDLPERAEKGHEIEHFYELHNALT